jgi:SsrA-binding protein
MKLLDQVRQIARVRHLSPRTEDCSARRLEPSARFHQTPQGFGRSNALGGPEVERVLAHFAPDRHVTASTRTHGAAHPPPRCLLRLRVFPSALVGYNGGEIRRATMGRSPAESEEIKVICRNRRATHDYEVQDTIECGIVLTGTEVKSLRDGHAGLEDAYAKLDRGEVWLIGSDIPEYSMGNRLNHKPKRARKLLLHRREIEKFAGKASQKGFTLVPLQLYFKGPRAKVLLAVCRGKASHDKRQALKKADAQKEIRRAMSQRRRS